MAPPESDSRHTLLTIQELSNRSGVPVVTLRRWVRQGRIPYLQPAGHGGRLLFQPDALGRSQVQSTAQQTSATPPLSGPQPKWTQSKD